MEVSDEIIAGRARAVAAWQDLGMTRLGMAGYCCILAYLTAGPATTIDVWKDFGLSSRQHVRELVNRMGELGLAHTVGSQRTGPAGPASPLWLAGAGEVSRLGWACREKFAELMQLRVILRAMGEPSQAKALARETGSHEMTINQLVRLLTRLGLAHLHSWDPPARAGGNGLHVACWVIGPGRSAPRPAPQPLAVIRRRTRAARRDKRRAMAISHALAGTAGATMGAAA
ncbi:hypothetical protein ABIC63_000525 [Pseudacidovorax sp. 1753]|uniref:hypothetical protein n=1 Tax=Pseudacidovorax sp. 1753 TaxID=3156419 RepID=UPI0033927E98